MPTTASIEEVDSPFMACVMLTTAENVMLDDIIIVEINTNENTGEIKNSTKTFYDICAYILSTATNLDYEPLIDEQLMFLAGDSNGTERCINITILQDMLVECEEDFNITLTIVKEQQNLVLGEATTTVSIIDSDGTILTRATATL